MVYSMTYITAQLTDCTSVLESQITGWSQILLKGQHLNSTSCSAFKCEASLEEQCLFNKYEMTSGSY